MVDRCRPIRLADSQDASKTRLTVGELDPRFDPGSLVDAHHDPGLVIKIGIFALDAQRRRKISLSSRPEEMPGVASEAIMGGPPEI